MLPQEVDSSSVLKALQQVAVLVQGCWAVKSEILYPKDSYSAYSSSPAELISRARDYLVCLPVCMLACIWLSAQVYPSYFL